MKIPFTPWHIGTLETRDTAYTDTVVAALLAAAKGDVADGLAAAVEICAGQWQRAMASAELKPMGVIPDALQPHLGYIGRALVERGEAVFEIAFTDRLVLRPASTVTVAGGADPSTWVYELTLPGPSETVTRTVAANRVLHLMYARSASTPWRGVSPIGASQTTRDLLDHLEKRLAQETGASVGSLIPVPNVQATGQLQSDLKAMKGELTLVESTVSGWGAGQTGAPQSDYQVRRIGANPPATLQALRKDAEASILAACGVPPTVLIPGQGTAAREAYRQFLHMTIAPIALELAAQVRAAFDLDALDLSFDRLMASDLSGRARAFTSLVGGGMDVSEAARLSGLMVDDGD